MKYSYSIEGYRPRNVSFEVSAILMEEEKRQALAGMVLKDTILGKYNYTRNGYSIEMAIGFDAILNKQFVNRQNKQKRREASKSQRIIQLNNQEQNAKIEQTIAERILHKSQAVAQIILENMLRKYNILVRSGRLSKSEKLNLNFLDVRRINEALKRDALVVKTSEMKAKYTIQPHVESLLREREKSRNLGRYR